MIIESYKNWEMEKIKLCSLRIFIISIFIPVIVTRNSCTVIRFKYVRVLLLDANAKPKKASNNSPNIGIPLCLLHEYHSRTIN